MLNGEGLQELGHGRLFLLLNPDLLEGLEETLEEFSHEAEASALVEEVKLLVVLVWGAPVNKGIFVRDHLGADSSCMRLLFHWFYFLLFVVGIGWISLRCFASSLNLLFDLGFGSHVSLFSDSL